MVRKELCKIKKTLTRPIISCSARKVLQERKRIFCRD
jgi:hypothetical protein